MANDIDVNNVWKRDDETELQYIWRICSNKDSGLLDMTWRDVADILNSELVKDESDYLDESAYRKKYQMAKAFYDDVFSSMISNEYHDALAQQRRKLQEEKVKLQTEKLEYNRWLRENARDEMFEEKVIDAIKKYSGTTVPPRKIEITHNKREGLLCLADCHFGKEFKIYGLYDEVINEYSPEIFYERMNTIFSDTLDQIKKEQLSSIHIYNLGDSVEGFIRNSQMWSLRWGVVDQAVIFGNYMGEWLRQLSEYVHIKYHQTDGNHDELRLLDGRKGQHLCESAGKIVLNSIKLKNEGNPNFECVSNKTGLIFDNICGFNILGVHGEVSDLPSAIKDFETIYNEKISYLISGHKHHSDFKNCGVRKACIGVGSIVGSDEFSMQLRRCADASTTFIVFEEGRGRVDEHICVLN